MAGSELWVRVYWQHATKKYSFLVKSVRTGLTEEFTSESIAYAVVRREDELDNTEFTASRKAVLLEAAPADGTLITGTDQVLEVVLDDGEPMFFGVGENGSLITGISLDSAEIEAALKTGPSPHI